MSEVQRAVPSSETVVLHEPLTDEYFSDLLAAVGSEGKASLLIAINAEQDGGLSRGELTNVYYRATDSSPHEISKSTIVNWCDHSLGRYGLIDINDGIPKSYSISDEGRRLGVPLAGLLLEASALHEVPLMQIFGEPMSSGGVRSPIVRLRIAEELLTHPKGASLPELTKSTGVASQIIIGKHLRKLNNAGLLTYKDWDESRNETTYELLDKEYVLASTASEVTRRSIEYLKQHESATLQELADYSAGELQLQASATRRNDPKQLISIAFSDLRKRKVIGNVEARIPGGQINVSLTPEQAELWSDIAEKLEAFKRQEPDVIARYRDIAKDLLTSPVAMHNAHERHIQGSSRIKSVQEGNLGQVVLGIIQQSPQSLTTREIERLVSEKRAGAVAHFSILRCLKQYVEQGLLTETTDKVARYGASQLTSKD
jgi:DNA-binding transcriptional ArsR family regulator